LKVNIINIIELKNNFSHGTISIGKIKSDH